MRSQSSPKSGPDAEGDEVVERLVDQHHQVGTDREPVLPAQALVGAELLRPADACLDRARHAACQERLPAEHQRLGDLVLRRFADRRPDVLEGRLTQHPGRFAVLVAIDRAAVRVGRRGGDPGESKRAAIGDADVVAGADKQDRMIRRNRIEIVPRRVTLLLQARLIVAATDDPGTRWAVIHRTPDKGDQVPDRSVRRRSEIEVGQREPDRHRVSVGIVQTRRRGSAVEIDRLHIRRGGSGPPRHRRRRRCGRHESRPRSLPGDWGPS